MQLEHLKELVRYDLVTGRFYWLARGIANFDTKFSGREAFTSCDAYGYRQGRIANQSIKPHRLAFAFANGRWPVGEVDHINGDRQDNRACNLREVSPSQNRRNMRARRSALPLGVHKSGKSGWRAVIKTDGKFRHLGSFATIAEAALARKAAEAEAGFHPNHGAFARTQSGAHS